MRFLILLQILGLFTVAFGFHVGRVSTRSMARPLSMAASDAAVKNMPRKLKRKIRSADATTFGNLLSAENDTFLKSECKGTTYERIMKSLQKKARQLKLTVKPGFGEKPKVLAPTIIETATSAGTFTVSVYTKSFHCSLSS